MIGPHAARAAELRRALLRAELDAIDADLTRRACFERARLALVACPHGCSVAAADPCDECTAVRRYYAAEGCTLHRHAQTERRRARQLAHELLELHVAAAVELARVRARDVGPTPAVN